MGADTNGTGSKYRFIREIADGGMGSVSLAAREDGRFRRVYAVKRLKPAYREDERVRSMFLEEARIAGLLHHANIVGVVDVGEDEDGPYLVMEYVQGVSLAELIARAKDRGELIPVQVCAHIVKEVAQGLHASHELVGTQGQKLELVHRDVSPQNILVGYDGTARLTDFGIAKAIGRTDKTNTGMLKGKHGYFSPEQLQFEDPTRQSDIFSLGVVFYEALSCERLYNEDEPAKSARRILKEPPPDIDDVRNDVHPGVLELMIRMLAKDPTKRPSVADEVADRLGGVLVDLASTEGLISVSKYVSDRFQDKQRQQMVEIEELTGELELNPLSSRPRRPSPVRLGLYATLVAVLLVTGAVQWLTPEIPMSTRRGVSVNDRVARVDVAPETETKTKTGAETVSEPEPPKRARLTKRAKRKPVRRTTRSAKPQVTEPVVERAERDLMDWAE